MPDNEQSNQVRIFDTTLRDGEQSPGFSLTTPEKLDFAICLAELGVDVIEAGFPVTSLGDAQAVSSIAQQVREPIICALARAVMSDIEQAAHAIQSARQPRIHTFIATSEIHRIKKLGGISQAEIIDRAAAAVERARQLVDDVEFSAEDASRTEPDFLVEVFKAVIAAGATTINVPDTVGYSTPWEYFNLIDHIAHAIAGLNERYVISVHCHNDLGNAVPNSLAGILGGARQVECTINGIGERAGNAALEEIVMQLHTRQDYFKVTTGVCGQRLCLTSRLLTTLTGVPVQPNKAIVGSNAFAHEAGIHQDGMLKDKGTYEIMRPEAVGWSGQSLVMGKHSGRAGLEDRLHALSLVVDRDDISQLWSSFKELCDLKGSVFDADLIMLVQEHRIRHQVNHFDLFDLNHFSYGREGQKAWASVTLKRNGKNFSGLCEGDGAIDAAFKAVVEAVGQDDPSLRRLVMTTWRPFKGEGGSEALGWVVVESRLGDHIGRGRAAKPDVVEATFQAVVYSINHLVATPVQHCLVAVNE